LIVQIEENIMKSRAYRPKISDFIVFAAALAWAGSAAAAAAAAPLPLAGADNTGAPYAAVAGDRLLVQEPDADQIGLAPNLRRQLVDYPRGAAAGTIVIDTSRTFLYFVLGNGKAIRYGIGVGREGFTWSGVEQVTRKAEWPDWIPPAEMIARQPYLARFTAGGEGNPLGARAIYIGNTMYRIHGTNMPETIGHMVSSGCIRLLNADVIDLYNRVNIGTRIVVLPNRDTVAVIEAASMPKLPAYDTRPSNVY
jgi:lipoprotein-anchoring transpeptidase ErfK/SrfK